MDVSFQGKSNTAKFIEELYQDNLIFYSDERGKGALRNIQQTFPFAWIYVAELIQNAVDEKATRLSFQITDKKTLVFEHNGNPFRPEDVKSLCTRGVSTKSVKTIGFMGVGFKSVFKSFEKATISSGEWKFYLEVPLKIGSRGDQQRNWIGCVLPRFDETIQAPSKGMTCRFLMTKRLDALQDVYDDLQKVFQEDSTLLPLLALQGIEELQWNGQEYLLSTKKSPLKASLCEMVKVDAVCGDTPNIDFLQWIVFSKEYLPSEAAIKKFLEHREVSPQTPKEQAQVDREIMKARAVQIFCKIDDENVPVLPAQGRAFSVLPTQVLLPLRINVQADWLLDISRKSFMDIKGNHWQQEILKQLPALLRCFLEWLVDDSRPKGVGWWEGYNILPVIDPTDQRYDLFDKGLTKDFSDVLRDLKFLPILAENGYKFGSPEESRYLPTDVDQKLNHKKYFPWVLLGSNIFSLKTLGDVAFKSLMGFGILHQLSSSDLVKFWQDNKIVLWLKCWNTAEERKGVYVRLLSTLSSLIDDDDEDSLQCFPTQNWDWGRCMGIWASRESLLRLPANWQILNREQEIRSSLEAHLPKGTAILNSVIYFYTQRLVKQHDEREEFEEAKDYIEQIEEISLEALVESWWQTICTKPFTGIKAKEVIQFTRWVRSKQPNLRNLIRHAIASKSNGPAKLLPIEETLLSVPYSGAYRTLMFPDLPRISEKYYREDASSSSPTEWRSFFESGQPRPAGNFSIQFSLEKVPRHSDKVTEWFVEKPWLRATSLQRIWRDFKITNYYFHELDGTIPVVDTIGTDHLKAIAFAHWLGENPEMLAKNRFKIIAYIPYGTSYVSTRILSQEMSWVEDLQKLQWVPGNDKRCHMPADVLPELDKVRPDVPHAELSSELIEALQMVGIVFGKNIPQAAAISRFKVEAPVSDIQRIVELFDDIRAEIEENPGDRQMAEMMLMELAFLPLPDGVKTPDHLDRLPLSRIVRSVGPGKNRRSNLFNWVVSLDDYKGTQGVLDFLNTLERFLGEPIPTTTTFNQTLGFLRWVWIDNPPVEQVRAYIRSSYEYIFQDIDGDCNREHWQGMASIAKVFTSAKRWCRPKETYFDDIQRPEILKLIKDLEIATQGHLGSDLHVMKNVAELLELQLLSQRIEISSKVGNEISVPSHWTIHFSILASDIADYLTETSVEEENSIWPSVAKTALKRVSSIHRVVYDKSVKVDEREDQCDYDRANNVVLVKGNPDDFMPRLFEVLVDVWGLGKHGHLVARMASLLMAFDDEKKFMKGIGGLRAFCGQEDSDSTDKEESKTDEVERKIALPIGTGQETNETSLSHEREKQAKDLVRRDTEPGREGASNEKGDFTKENELSKRKVDDHSDVDQAKSRPSEHRRRTGRIITYVYPVDDEKDDEHAEHLSPADKERIDLIGNSAEEYVLKVLGERATRMPKNHPGYDIEYYFGETKVQYIEVKGIDGLWSELGVGITARQYEEARKKGNAYWLYVVEYVLSENPVVHRFQNPAALIGNYRFDHNWRSIEFTTDQGTTTGGRLEPGSKVLVDGESATIEEIVTFGKLGPAFRICYSDGMRETIRDSSKINIVTPIET